MTTRREEKTWDDSGLISRDTYGSRVFQIRVLGVFVGIRHLRKMD